MNQSNHLELARFNMIEQQIRPAEVLDPKVLAAMENTPREAFVPDSYKELAFSDSHIPISATQVMMTPIQEARMLQALDVLEGDKILEIGTGSAYMTALLAKLGNHITSVEIDPALSQSAKQRLQTLGVDNVTLETGDAGKGWPQDAAEVYDVIAVTGSIPILEQQLKNQLTIGGRLCAIVGNKPVMQCVLVTRINEDQWREEALFETLLPSLDNVQLPPEFVF